MKKHYVSLETAKVLKEKGYIHQTLNRDEWYSEPPYVNPDGTEILYPKAQLHEVQQWFREEYNIEVTCYAQFHSYEYMIVDLQNKKVLDKSIHVNEEEESFDYAKIFEEAIVETLKLI